MFRVVVFSSGSAGGIATLVERIQREVPGARVCGVLLERRPGKSFSKRLSNFKNNLGDWDFVQYAGKRTLSSASRIPLRLATRVLHAVHGARPAADPSESLDQISQRLGCKFHLTADCHGAESLAFVRGLDADLGLVYGTRILKPCLFRIPRHGSINIHKRKVPDYRGGGPVGLWEMLDGQPEIGVTVHEVEEQLDAGAIVNSATIAIEPFDTLRSLATKAHVVANDLLVRSVAQYAAGTVQRVAQIGESRMFKNPRPSQLERYKKELFQRRPGFRASRGRSAAKLMLRSALGLPLVAMRNWQARLRGGFPVTILFHHLVADRPHGLGISTEGFIRQIEFLRTFYRIVSMKDALAVLLSGNVTAPTVVLTIDDGYRDNFLTLRAIREVLDVPMTLFVSTGIVSAGSRFPHDVRHGNEGFEPLTWDQVVRLRKDGFEIGSHTRTHFDCGSRDVALLRDEIVGSKQDLEEYLGERIEMFSFPFGLPQNMSPEAVAIAAQNYRYLFSAYGGNNFVSGQHLKRWAHPNDLWELELMIQGVLEFVPRNNVVETSGISNPHPALRADLSRRERGDAA
jgi:peptidoglycan/xylan/chitin deacetylase (PgdA/CDA1 family)